MSILLVFSTKALIVNPKVVESNKHSWKHFALLKVDGSEQFRQESGKV
jgi:hypothetical protein